MGIFAIVALCGLIIYRVKKKLQSNVYEIRRSTLIWHKAPPSSLSEI